MTSWVLIDQSKGAKCHNGDTLSQGSLETIAEAADIHMNRDFASEWGVAGGVKVRIGKDATDVAKGEQVCFFVPDFPKEPDASAFHTLNNQNVPVSYVAVTTCASLFGPSGIVMDVTHELGEAKADPGVNLVADDLRGLLHAYEPYDPVEIQAYPIRVSTGQQVYASNFVTQNWFIPGSIGPYDFMTRAGLPGADPKYAPPGPLMTAPSPDGLGNYQMIEPGGVDGLKSIFNRLIHGAGMRPVGTPRKMVRVLHWSSRSFRRMAKRRGR